MAPTPDDVRSKRESATIERLYAFVTTDLQGREGIIRRDTPSGTQPWITDDPALVGRMQGMIRAAGFEGEVSLALFERVRGG